MVEITCTGTESLKLSALTEFQGNLKDLKTDKYKKLRAAIESDGFSYPFFVWKNGKKNMVFDGHQRLRVLGKMAEDGVQLPESFPVVYIEAKDEKHAARKLLKLNERYGEVTGEGLYEYMDTFDIEMDEIRGLDIPEIDIEHFEAEFFMEGLGGVDADEVPAVQEEPVSERGKVYQCGVHRVMCGDSTEKTDMGELIGGAGVDMVFTDPPYGMCLDTDWSEAKSGLSFAKDKNVLWGKKYNKVIGDNNDFTPRLIETIFENFGHCKEVFLWGADYYSGIVPNKEAGSWFVWDKRLDESADRMYGSCFELCYSKARHKREIARVKWAGVFGTEKEFDHKRHHPTQKPVELVLWFFNKYKGGVVADPFLGSGSTLIACEKTHRICYGMEIDPHYVDVIRKRWAEFVHGLDCDWQALTPEAEHGNS